MDFFGGMLQSSGYCENFLSYDFSQKLVLPGRCNIVETHIVEALKVDFRYPNLLLYLIWVLVIFVAHLLHTKQLTQSVMGPFTSYIRHAMKCIMLHFGGGLECSIYHMNVLHP